MRSLFSHSLSSVFFLLFFFLFFLFFPSFLFPSNSNLEIWHRGIFLLMCKYVERRSLFPIILDMRVKAELWLFLLVVSSTLPVVSETLLSALLGTNDITQHAWVLTLCLLYLGYLCCSFLDICNYHLSITLGKTIAWTPSPFNGHAPLVSSNFLQVKSSNLTPTEFLGLLRNSVCTPKHFALDVEWLD